MSDVNVLLTAVDNAIDLLDKYKVELSDIHACGLFDLESTCELVRRKCCENQNKIEAYEYNACGEDYQCEADSTESELPNLYHKQREYNDLRYEVISICDEKKAGWTSEYRKSIALIDTGKSIMLEYILKLNDISLAGAYSRPMATRNTPDYYVIIVDSKKYPQTAEHIKWAVKKGLPEFVTLGRKEAAQRRKDSLRSVKVSPIYDRDEWPMACFEEGGSGADVFYLDRSDNRGSGSSIRHQMSRIPNGARIRIRIL